MTSEKENKYKTAKTITAIINLIPIFIGIEYLASSFGYSLLLDLPETTFYQSLSIGLSTIFVSIILFIPILRNGKKTNKKEYDVKSLKPMGYFTLFSILVFSLGVHLLLGGRLPGVVGTANSFHTLYGYELILSLMPISIGIILISTTLEIFSDNVKKLYKK